MNSYLHGLGIVLVDVAGVNLHELLPSTGLGVVLVEAAGVNLLELAKTRLL